VDLTLFAVSDAKIVMADNGSGSSELDDLRVLEASSTNVTLIVNEENLGYFGGLNRGIQLLREQFPEISHIVVGNNELEFPSTFSEDVLKCDGCLNIHAVVSPDILTADGGH
jgi:hypothetical protein